MHNNSPNSNPNDSQREQRDADQADTARKHVVQNVAQSGQATPSSTPPQTTLPERGDDKQEQPLVKKSGRRPGEVSPQLGQDSGSDWQESQQMGQTGRGGVQNPQTNP